MLRRVPKPLVHIRRVLDALHGLKPLARYLLINGKTALLYSRDTVNWTELLAQAADSAEQAQLVLDSALAAVAAARSTALDATIAAEMPTAAGLCALLDAYGVRAPGEVAARVCWYAKPQPASTAEQPVPVREDLYIVKQPGF
jgi:hypothetical protein